MANHSKPSKLNQRQKKRFEGKLVSEFKKRFDTRLVGILGYGSFFQGGFSRDGDVDLVIILDKNGKKDNQKIRASFRSLSSRCYFQAQVVYKNILLKDASYYSINTSGPFFLRILKTGDTLYGQNILGLLDNPDRKIFEISVLQKVQQYLSQLKHFYFNLGRTEEKVIKKFITKKTRCLSTDFTLFFGRESKIQKCPEGKEIKKIVDSLLIINTNRPLEKLLLDTINVTEVAYFTMVKCISRQYGTPFIK